MFYEVTSKRNVVDLSGNNRETTEKFILKELEFFSEAENKILEYFNNECTVTAIKQSKVMEFANERDDSDQYIYLATLEQIFIDEKSGAEKSMKYLIGLFAENIDDATNIANEYKKQIDDDMHLVCVKKTKFADLL